MSSTAAYDAMRKSPAASALQPLQQINVRFGNQSGGGDAQRIEQFVRSPDASLHGLPFRQDHFQLDECAEALDLVQVDSCTPDHEQLAMFRDGPPYG